MGRVPQLKSRTRFVLSIISRAIIYIMCSALAAPLLGWISPEDSLISLPPSLRVCCKVHGPLEEEPL